MYSNKLNNYQDKKTFNCLLHWQSLPRVGRGGGGVGVWHKELFFGTMNNLQTRYNLWLEFVLLQNYWNDELSP